MSTPYEDMFKLAEQDMLPAMTAETERLRPQLAAAGMTASDPVLYFWDDVPGEEHFVIEVTVMKGSRVRAFIGLNPFEDLNYILDDRDLTGADAAEWIRKELDFQCRRPNRHKLHWWPVHHQRIFATLGTVLGDRRLTPGMLAAFPKDFVANHTVEVEHAPFDDHLRREEHYKFGASGPLYSGIWDLDPDDFEGLLRQAAKARRNGAL